MADEIALADTTAFAALRRETLDFLVGRARPIHARAGDVFLREGEPGGNLYVVLRGRVEVYLDESAADGEPTPRVPLAELGPGDCLGETSLLGILPRTASVLALTDCELAVLRGKDLFDLSELDAHEFALLVMNLAREVSRRLWRMNERLREQLRRS
jgi:CRP/FNR family transcriptional regulator, cyclic AMP receptor protein